MRGRGQFFGGERREKGRVTGLEGVLVTNIYLIFRGKKGSRGGGIRIFVSYSGGGRGQIMDGKRWAKKGIFLYF